MHTSYEAIYEDGELEWVGDEPEPGRHRVHVTVLDSDSKNTIGKRCVA